jgi:hypothetical protein
MRVLQVRLPRRRKAGIAMLLAFGHGLNSMKLDETQCGTIEQAFETLDGHTAGLMALG